MISTRLSNAAWPALAPSSTTAPQAQAGRKRASSAPLADTLETGPRLPPELLDIVVAAVPPRHVETLEALAQTSRAMAHRVERLYPRPARAEVHAALARHQADRTRTYPSPEVSACLRRARALQLDDQLYKNIGFTKFITALRPLQGLRSVTIADAGRLPSARSWPSHWPSALEALPHLQRLMSDSASAGVIGAALRASDLALWRLEALVIWPSNEGGSLSRGLSMLEALNPARLRVLHLGGLRIEHLDDLQHLQELVQDAPGLRSLELPDFTEALKDRAQKPMRALFEVLGAKTKLEHLSVDLVAVDADGCRALELALRAQPQLTSLNLFGMEKSSVSRAAMSDLIVAAPGLHALGIEMQEDAAPGDQLCFVEAMASCPQLRHLSLSSQAQYITKDAIEVWGQLVSQLQGITSVAVENSAILPQHEKGTDLIDAILMLPQMRTIAVYIGLDPDDDSATWLEHVEAQPESWQHIETLRAEVDSVCYARRLAAAACRLQSLKTLEVCLQNTTARKAIEEAMAPLDERGIAWQIKLQPWR